MADVGEEVVQFSNRRPWNAWVRSLRTRQERLLINWIQRWLHIMEGRIERGKSVAFQDFEAAADEANTDNLDIRAPFQQIVMMLAESWKYGDTLRACYSEIIDFE